MTTKKNRRIASLKKETIRKLDSVDLEKVHGGKLILQVPNRLPYTALCQTDC